MALFAALQLVSMDAILPEQDLLKPREAQNWLGVSERTLWRFIAEGRIAHVRVGAQVRFKRDDIEEFITSNRVGMV